ncbi:hypothetical protein M0813_23635 [Anaeramoeba flamelloides]|uniref:Uncharacterized protein n=1 Tax=Anaeramoeba flamelloides TaxID=1746091 RepID=A0ABQ8Y851_9EUKA|nr:hypothetical protein M0813_23635 [Anaeramoeba flamelloides]
MCTSLGKLALKALALSAGLSLLKKKDIFELDVNTIGNEKLRHYTEIYLQIGDYVLDKACDFLEIEIYPKEQQKEFSEEDEVVVGADEVEEDYYDNDDDDEEEYYEDTEDDDFCFSKKKNKEDDQNETDTDSFDI